MYIKASIISKQSYRNSNYLVVALKIHQEMNYLHGSLLSIIIKIGTMKLRYTASDIMQVEIKERMEMMTLAFEREQVKLKEPILIDGKNEIVGVKAITEHLDILAGELHGWYYCNC